MIPATKREKILQAALVLITEQGFHGAPIADIAEKAEVGAGTIYRYFANKDILITELFQMIHDKICAELLENYDVQLSFKERFHHLLTTLLKHFIANPLEFRYVEQYHNSPYGLVFRKEQILGASGERAAFRVLLEEAINQSVIKNLPLSTLFAIVFGSLVSVARDHIIGFVTLDDILINKFVDACWDGITVSRPVA